MCRQFANIELIYWPVRGIVGGKGWGVSLYYPAASITLLEFIKIWCYSLYPNNQMSIISRLYFISKLAVTPLASRYSVFEEERGVEDKKPQSIKRLDLKIKSLKPSHK